MKRNDTERGKGIRIEMQKFIITYITKHGYSPSVREIGDGVGLKSPGGVQAHLNKMFETGMLETDTKSGTHRAIRVPGYKFVKA